jgi:wobble nucleotide-excising tRNase
MLAAATKLVADANAAVEAHNEIVRNITKERADLTGQVWKYVLEIELKADLSAYATKRAGISAAITNLNTQIQEATTSKLGIMKDIKALEKSATSIEPTIDGINALLKSFGFRSFSLAKADDGRSINWFVLTVAMQRNRLARASAHSSRSFTFTIYSKVARTRVE